MYDDPQFIKNNPEKFRLDTPSHRLFVETARRHGLQKAVYARRAVEQQLKIDNDQRLQEKARRLGMTAGELTDYILNQFLLNDSQLIAQKEGTQNDHI